ncbi:MAG: 2-oxoglutarate dehydrogenase complex dihydrolipoyllysine-residue succinyltransferase [Candidatus Cloacimonetes bacterium]|nr:2-oxoglutarate dehydrogenase complex dihydrolipoyllysine-residue succinyltransferase [Candidatus Cloacimonadota bacterium]
MDIILPSPGESVTEAEIAQWHKKDGEFVEKDEVVLEVETDKAALEIVADCSGILKIHQEEGAVVEVGTLLATITPGSAQEDSSPALDSSAKAVVTEAPAVEASGEFKDFESPAVGVLAKSNGIDVKDVNGTGKDGRVTKSDIQDYLAKQSKSAPVVAPKVEEPIESVFSEVDMRTEEPKKIPRIRRKIAQRLKEVQNTAAILTTFNEVDMTEIMALRSRYKDEFKEKHGVGLGFMSLFSKACVEALKQFPDVNAEWRGEELVYRNYADVGIAVGTDKGLVVPVVKNAQSMSLASIEKEIRRLALKARDGKLSVDDMTGGTFTITNGGVFGSMLSTPILNAPQTAILGMHNIVKRPMVVDNEIKIRPVMYLALSYDHRVIDGSEAVSFLVSIKNSIEDPARLLLEL